MLHASGLTHVVGTPAYMAPEQAIGGRRRRARRRLRAGGGHLPAADRPAWPTPARSPTSPTCEPPAAAARAGRPAARGRRHRAAGAGPRPGGPVARRPVVRQRRSRPLAPERGADPAGQPARTRATPDAPRDDASASGLARAARAGVRRGVPGLLRRCAGGHPAAALTPRTPIPGPGPASPHYRARWVTPPLVARPLRHPPAWRDRKRHQHVRRPSVPATTARRPPLDGVDVFELGAEHEQVVFCNDPATGLRAIIAIHSTALGPGLGGTRFYPYASTADAIRDVLNLSRGMSYKAALAGLDLGGGKAVIIGDPTKDKTEALLRAYGRFVQSLERPLLHRLRRRHLLRRHGRHGARVRLRHRPHRRPRWRRRLVGAHGVRRLPGHARERRGASGAPRRWPAAPSASPASARSATTWSSTSSRTARGSWSPTCTRRRSSAMVARVRRHRGRRRRRAGAGRDRRLRAVRDGRRAHRRGGRRADRRRSSAAPPTTSSPTRASRRRSPTAGSSTRPTTA